MHPRIEAFPDFVTFAQRLQPTPPAVRGYAFRGHADAGWDLKPKLIRLVEERARLENMHTPIPPEFAFDIEIELTREFKERAHLHVDSSTLITTKNLESTLSTWALMRHFGAPTRLLDWTWSAYVALYFAVIDHFDIDGAIWYVNRPQYDILIQDLRNSGRLTRIPTDPRSERNWFYLGGSNLPIFWDQPFPVSRMVAQQGFFSFTQAITPNHDDELNEASKEGVLSIGQVIIPMNRKVEFLRELRAMNITADSLFPGLEGLGRSMNEFARLVG